MPETSATTQKPAPDAGSPVSWLFEGPPERFLDRLMSMLCRVGPATAGAVLRVPHEARAQAQVLALHPAPEDGQAPEWLRVAAEGAATLGHARSIIAPLGKVPGSFYDEAPRKLVLVALSGGPGFISAAAFVVEAGDSSETAVRHRLELAPLLLEAYETRSGAHRQTTGLEKLRLAMETLAALNEQTRFNAAAMGLCNEIASRWRCERVSIGLPKGRYVRVEAMSHTERVIRKMQTVQDVEAAMEECLDQDLEVCVPAPPGSVAITRAAERLAGTTMSVCGLPLRRGGEVVGVLTVERPADRPLEAEEVEALRLTCDLCTARLVELRRHDRWAGARLAAWLRRQLALLVGPKHTWMKVGAAATLAALLFLVFAKGTYRVESSMRLEALERRLVPAPFDGYLSQVMVDVGDEVDETTVLAVLDDSELRLRLASAKAEKASRLKESSVKQNEGKTAESQIAQAAADKAQAEINLLEHKISQAKLPAAMKGRIVKGDLKRLKGAPVRTGEVLFEVSPVHSLRAELQVPEDQIGDVALGQSGELAVASYPAERIAFVIERIDPVAEVVGQRNVFNVRARLGTTMEWMRPGMEGVAKIDVDQRRYAWIWSRRLVNWVRMQLWI